ncbi:hypothetical protein F971_00807 [Acinetobacter vivianii]|uniref:Uncharacterized protein n=1 Tax=Acinetobacter vivianii TaxID=1776742 RepID=N8WF38_9GAMM|nr:hypothetical protein [Acinetobacter vivianii]ENU93549.1 hypothetical protein F971_00807 [Acinetobacter vivianii]
MRLFSENYEDNEKFHTKYRLLSSHLFSMGQRQILQEWADGFVDRDGKVLLEFQTTFHSMLWEFYIHQVLKEMGGKLDFSKNRPDFIVQNPDGSHKMYIEAVVSQIKQDGRKEESRSFNDIIDVMKPLWKLEDYHSIINEGIVRASNSINGKLKKYQQYSKLDWIDTKVPYIIGVSSYSQVNYGLESHYSIFALLYGLYMNVDGISWFKKHNIVKPDTESEIALNIFNDEAYSDISAIMFSSKVTLGKLANMAKSRRLAGSELSANVNLYFDDTPPYFKPVIINEENPESLVDGLMILHNPNAKVPLDKTIFSKLGITQIYIEDGELEIDAVRPFLINRFHSEVHSGMDDIIAAMYYNDYNFPSS